MILQLLPQKSSSEVFKLQDIWGPLRVVRKDQGFSLACLRTEECLEVNLMMNGLHHIGRSWSTSKPALNSSLNKRSEEREPT